MKPVVVLPRHSVRRARSRSRRNHHARGALLGVESVITTLRDSDSLLTPYYLHRHIDALPDTLRDDAEVLERREAARECWVISG